MAENRTNMIDDETLEKIAGGDLDGFQATLIALMVVECKKNGLTLDETVNKITSAFKEKNTDYFEAIGLIYETWRLS